MQRCFARAFDDPEWHGRASDELAANPHFAAALLGRCRASVGLYLKAWDLFAQQAAGSPIDFGRDKNAVDALVIGLIRDMLPQVVAHRAELSVASPEEARSDMMHFLLSGKAEDTPMSRLLYPAAACVARKEKLKADTGSCGKDEARKQLDAALLDRFPASRPDDRQSVVGDAVAQGQIWALIGSAAP
jgi:hypothetical protein